MWTNLSGDPIEGASRRRCRTHVPLSVMKVEPASDRHLNDEVSTDPCYRGEARASTPQLVVLYAYTGRSRLPLRLYRRKTFEASFAETNHSHEKQEDDMCLPVLIPL